MVLSNGRALPPLLSGAGWPRSAWTGRLYLSDHEFKFVFDIARQIPGITGVLVVQNGIEIRKAFWQDVVKDTNRGLPCRFAVHTGLGPAEQPEDALSADLPITIDFPMVVDRFRAGVMRNREQLFYGLVSRDGQLHFNAPR